MTPVETIVQFMLSQDGDRYVFGAEASPSDSDPTAFDCSELVQWGCARAGVQPTMPDGSWIQARHCKNEGTLIPVEQAIKVRGALLFKFRTDPFSGSRPPGAHVAMSLGNGQTIEARSTYYGVGMFSAYGRGWTHAALVPGANYETTIEKEEQMIERGHPVESVVADIQSALQAWDSEALPRWGVDGDYGSETSEWVSKFQSSKGVLMMGAVDGLTHSLLEVGR